MAWHRLREHELTARKPLTYFPTKESQPSAPTEPSGKPPRSFNALLLALAFATGLEITADFSLAMGVSPESYCELFCNWLDIGQHLCTGTANGIMRYIVSKHIQVYLWTSEHVAENKTQENTLRSVKALQQQGL